MGIAVGQTVNANLFRGAEAVGGKLTFEETEMVFESHALNIQRGRTAIPYSEITDIQERRTLGLVPNGITVVLRNGCEHRLVVNKRKDIIAFLRSRIG